MTLGVRSPQQRLTLANNFLLHATPLGRNLQQRERLVSAAYHSVLARVVQKAHELGALLCSNPVLRNFESVFRAVQRSDFGALFDFRSYLVGVYELFF